MPKLLVLLVLTLQAVAPAAAPPPAPAGPTTSYAIDPTTITLIGGILVTVVGTIMNGVLAIITQIQVKAMNAQQHANTNQLVTVAKDTAVISGHVNSEKTAAQGREAALQQENRLLRDMLTDKATTLAQLQGATPPPPRPGRATDPPPAPLPVEVVNAPTVTIADKLPPPESGPA